MTLTRPTCELRFGIRTIREKWESALKTKASWATVEHLRDKFRMNLAEHNVLVNGRYMPSEELAGWVASDRVGEVIKMGNTVVAAILERDDAMEFIESGQLPEKARINELDREVTFLEHITDLFSRNDFAIRADFERMTEGRTSAKVSDTNTIIGDQLFVEEGVEIEGAIINTTTGPVYLAKDSHVLEGTVVRGPLALCEGAALKMAAKVYGATTIGPYCKVGGEVSNVVFQGYSNKGHDGFLGNAIIGEWCNLGADTNSSNLKNNYGLVNLYHYPSKSMVKTEMQFCGLIMGDHSKCGINTMFNTATVVGVSANIFGAGFPDKFIPSFTWGGIDQSDSFDMYKAFEVADRMMNRRGEALTNEDKNILMWIREYDNSGLS